MDEMQLYHHAERFCLLALTLIDLSAGFISTYQCFLSKDQRNSNCQNESNLKYF